VAEYINITDAEKGKIVQMLPLLKSNISLSLEGELKTRNIFKKIVRHGAASGNVIILEGRFIEFYAGSRTLKFFGAGKAAIKFKGRLIDGASGKELAAFEDKVTGYHGELPLESYEDLFPLQAKVIGESLSKFFEKLY
jgi:hypothetical protein